MTRRERWAVGFAGLVALLLFLPSVRYGFLRWDDQANYILNPHFQSLAWPALRWMFTTHYQGPYQPLSWLSAALDYKMWGLSAMGFRLTNILLHALSACLFYVAALRLLNGLPHSWGIPPVASPRPHAAFGALFATLFFALHPLRVESVVWVTERRDVLSGFFFLASLLMYLRSRDADAAERPATQAFALAAFVCAALSKATAVGLIWVILAIDLYERRPLAEALREKLPWFLVGVAAAVANLAGFRTGALTVGRYGAWDRAQIFLYGLAFYVEKTLWPAHLAAYYELPKNLHALGGVLYAQAAIAFAVGAAAFLLRRRWPAIWLAWLAYALMLAPVSGLMQNGQQIVADRYSYLACMPWAVLLGAALTQFKSRHSRWANAIAVVWLGALAILTMRQLRYWKNDRTLWQHAVAVSPGSCLARYNLALTDDLDGNSTLAVEEYEAAVAQCPEDAGAWMNLGVLYGRLSALAQAERAYRAVLALRPGNADAEINLALIEAREGAWSESLALLRRAAAEHPDRAEVRFDLGVLEAERGMHDLARQDLRAALARAPDLGARLPTSLRREIR